MADGYLLSVTPLHSAIASWVGSDLSALGLFSGVPSLVTMCGRMNGPFSPGLDGFAHQVSASCCSRNSACFSGRIRLLSALATMRFA